MMSHIQLYKELEKRWEGNLWKKTIIPEVRGRIGAKNAIGILKYGLYLFEVDLV